MSSAEVPLCSGIAWETLGGLVHRCSSLPPWRSPFTPCGVGCAAAPLSHPPRESPEVRVSRQAGKQPTLLSVCVPSHSLFPLSSPQLQTSRQLQFGSFQRIPAQSLLLKFTQISHRQACTCGPFRRGHRLYTSRFTPELHVLPELSSRIPHSCCAGLQQPGKTMSALVRL